MERRYSGLLSAALAIAASGLAAAANAGNLALTIAGFAAPIDVQSFSWNAIKVPSTPGSSTVGNFGSAQFAAEESAATVLQMAKLTSRERLTTAQLQVRSPVTAQLVSDWTFTDLIVDSVSVIHAAAGNQPPATFFSLSFNRIAYRVYAADGSIARQTCFDIVANAAC